MIEALSKGRCGAASAGLSLRLVVAWARGGLPRILRPPRRFVNPRSMPRRLPAAATQQIVRRQLAAPGAANGHLRGQLASLRSDGQQLPSEKGVAVPRAERATAEMRAQLVATEARFAAAVLRAGQPVREPRRRQAKPSSPTASSASDAGSATEVPVPSAKLARKNWSTPPAVLQPPTNKSLNDAALL
ncbi:MAG: hypothetical protein AW08_02542 [Candidatus Accumulibacter adjunctus]|uniref:Uncharacterized protein n=1 Tax=Candidatus Accumulibacter adjunctus TaxID=1454001 RepID=A0A011M9N8_9PROT|nr:MAG: hypothetical protein AW08_02542 [Candidatus Accumulibacter adjunctus]